MTERGKASLFVYALGALTAGAIVAAILVVGPASGSQTSQTRTATVAQGVVQSTVSGSGNLQAASQLNLGFKTSGTVTHIYVTQGEQVAQGQLLATLDPQSAEVTLEQAKAALQSAEANLTKAEETGGEAGSGQAGSSAASGTGSASTGNASAVTAFAASERGASRLTAATTTTAPSSTPPASAPGKSQGTKSTGTVTGNGTTNESKESKSSSSSPSSTVSAATREADVASAKAAVKSDTLTVRSAEQAVQSTRLYAPESGTIASLSGQVGETVSATGTTKAQSASSSSAGGSAAGAGGGGARSSSAGSSSSSGSTSSSSSSFAVLADLSSMVLVVPLGESEIGNVKAGQIATVTIEALAGRKVAAHVSEVAILATSNSGVVSYDVTFALDQMEAGLKPGMSATAEVVVRQAEGLNVPTSAISGGSVTVLHNGKQTRQRVVTGLAGNSSTIILSGLQAGETVVLPSATTNAASTSTRRGLGGLGGGGGGGVGLGLGGGGAALFRGGGG